MPTFYDKLFKPSGSKRGLMRNKRSEWNMQGFDDEGNPVPIKDVEDYMIRQLFKTKKKSTANQKVAKK